MEPGAEQMHLKCSVASKTCRCSIMDVSLCREESPRDPESLHRGCEGKSLLTWGHGRRQSGRGRYLLVHEEFGLQTWQRVQVCKDKCKVFQGNILEKKKKRTIAGRAVTSLEEVWGLHRLETFYTVSGHSVCCILSAHSTIRNTKARARNKALKLQLGNTDGPSQGCEDKTK